MDAEEQALKLEWERYLVPIMWRISRKNQLPTAEERELLRPHEDMLRLFWPEAWKLIDTAESIHDN